MRRAQAEQGDNVATGDEAEAEDLTAIANACKGLAVTVVPVVSQLGRGRD